MDTVWSMMQGKNCYHSSTSTGQQYVTPGSRKRYSRTNMATPQQWSCIDYVIMHQKDRRMCLDVSVKREAECNTDHQLLCAKFRLRKWTHKKRISFGGGKQYDVSKLVGVYRDSSAKQVKEKYQELVLDKAANAWPEGGSVEEK